MKKILVLLFSILVLSLGIGAQSSPQFFNAVYFTSGAPSKAIVLSDGSTVLVGSDSDAAKLVKIGTNQQLINIKEFGGGLLERTIKDAVEVDDGIIVVGEDWNPITTSRTGFVGKVSKDLNVVLVSDNLPNFNTSLYSCTKSYGNNVIIGGVENNNGKYWFVDPNLTTILSSGLVTDFDIVQHVSKTTDGAYLFVGSFDEGSACDGGGVGFSPEPEAFLYDQLIVKKVFFNGSQPTTSWTRFYGGESPDIFVDAMPTANGGFSLLAKSNCVAVNGCTGHQCILSGEYPNYSTGASGYDHWLVSVDGNGNLLWNKKVGYTTIDFSGVNSADAYGIVATCDNNIVLGETGSASFSQEILTKYDLNQGFQIWESSTSSISNSYKDLVIDSEGNFVAVTGFDFNTVHWSPDPICETELCDLAETIWCGQTITRNNSQGENNLIASNYSICTTPILGTFSAREQIFELNIDPFFPTENIDIYLNSIGIDHDVFLYYECDNIGLQCVAYSKNMVSNGFNIEQIYIENPASGTYYIVVDGSNSNDEGIYDLTISCGTPDCGDTEGVLSCDNNILDFQNNINSDNYSNSYCGVTTPFGVGAGCTAGENVYEVNIQEAGEYTINLNSNDPNQDFELFLFADYSECIATNECIASATNPPAAVETLTIYLEPGDYYLVVDGWHGSTGFYSLELVCPSQGCYTCPLDALFNENFNTYQATGLASQSSAWDIFKPFLGYGDAQITPNGALSFNSSLGNQGVVRDLQGGNADWYKLTFDFYVESEKGGTFEVFHDNSSLISAYRVSFGTNQEATIWIGNEQVGSFYYQHDEWMAIGVLMRGGGDEAELFVNGDFKGSWQFSLGADINGTPVVSSGIGTLAYYTDGSNQEFLVDNICYTLDVVEVICNAEYDPVCIGNSMTLTNNCYAMVAGYSGCEITPGACQSSGCNDCLDCFYYTHEETNEHVVHFYDNYCYSGPLAIGAQGSEELSMMTNAWSFSDQFGNPINVEFKNLTNTNSANPICEFPAAGKYQVCQTISDIEAGELNTCCLDVWIAPTPCENLPQPTFTVQTPQFNNQFVFTANQGGADESYHWEVSGNATPIGSVDQNTFICGADFSTCFDVCLIVTNECGYSSCCYEYCYQAGECNTEPVNPPNVPQPTINTSNLTASFFVPFSSTFNEVSWTTADGIFLNGTNSNSNNPIIEFPSYGNYIVCVKLTGPTDCSDEICHCFTVKLPKPDNCNADLCVSNCCDNNCDNLTYSYDQSQGGLVDYNLNANVNPTEGEFCRWEITDQWGVTFNPANSEQITFSFVSGTTYTLCYYWYDFESTCLKKCCKTIYASDPYDCGTATIDWNYSNSGSSYQLTLNAGNVNNITWINDDTGAVLGTGSTITQSNFNGCQVLNVSARYYDIVSECWYICCKTIYICPPVDCEENLTYWYNGSSIELQLNATNIDQNSIQWIDDDTGAILASGTQNVVPLPVLPTTCVAKWITVKYFDYTSGCWYSCCRRILFCDPIQECSSSIDYYFNSTNQEYELTLNGANVDTSKPIEWINDNTGSVFGNSLSTTYPNNWACQEIPVSVRYYDLSSGCWRVCCKVIYICNPNDCESNILYQEQGNGSAILSVSGTVGEVEWFINNGSSPVWSGNNYTIVLPPGQTTTVYAYYYNIQSGCYYVCCKVISPNTCEAGICTSDCCDNNCDNLSYSFAQSQGSLVEYVLSSNVNPSEGNFCRWEITDQWGVTSTPGNSEQITFSFVSGTTYTLCYYWYDFESTCLKKCCKTIYASDPYDCGTATIDWNYSNSGSSYQLTLNAGNVNNITWINDDTGAVLGTGSTITQSNFNGCQVLNVSARYYDIVSECWYICCKTIYICPPVDCEENLTYWYNGSSIELQLNATNIDQSSIQWIDDDTGVTLATGTQNVVPLPVLPTTCVAKWITVKYFDYTSGCWYSCCRRILFCNPIQECSSSIDYYFNSTNQEYQLTLNGANVDTSKPIEWINDNTGSVFGNSLSTTYPNNWACQVTPVSVRYYDLSSGCWRVCCKVIYVCNPNNCTANIAYTDLGNGISTLSVSNNYSEVEWYTNSGTSPVWSGNTFNTSLPVGQMTTVYAYYYDSSSQCYYVCCKLITPGACQLPVANFSYQVNDETVIFNNNSVSTEGGAIYSWNFGDGQSSGLVNPNHTYTSPGFYEVCLTVTDACGSVDYCVQIAVSSLVFEVSEDVCDEPGGIVWLPIRVHNFNSIITFSQSIHIADVTKAKFTGDVSFINLPGLQSQDFNFVNNGLVTVAYTGAFTGNTQLDGAAIFSLKIELLGDIGDETLIYIDDNPIPLAAQTAIGAGFPNVPVSTIDNPVCIMNTSSDISGKLKTDALLGSQGIANATVVLSGNAAGSMTTNTSGDYEFENLTSGMNYSIVPTKDILHDGNGMVNLADAFFIKHHFLGNLTFDKKYQFIAGDMDEDGDIDVFDSFIAKNVFLGLFPNSNLTFPSWKFVPENEYLQLPLNPLSVGFNGYKNYMPLLGTEINQDFIGIKIGDVDGNVSPNPLLQQDDIQFAASMESGTFESEVVVDISVADFENIILFSHGLEWDESKLELLGVEDIILTDLLESDFAIQDNSLVVAWLGPFNGETVDDGTPIFKLRFKVIADDFVETAITFTDPFSAKNSSFEDVGISTTPGSISIESLTPVSWTHDKTDVSCKDGQDGSISLELSGGSGDYGVLWSNGATSISINNIPAGTYSATITDMNSGVSYVTNNIIISEPSVLTLANNVPMSDGNGGAMVTVTATGGVSPYEYFWPGNSSASSNVQDGLVSGNYTVTVTDTNDCDATISFEIDESIVSISELVHDASILLYPNPSIGDVTITLGDRLSFIDFESIRIYNVEGREVANLNVTYLIANQGSFELSLPSDVYFVRMMIGNQLVIKRLVIIN